MVEDDTKLEDIELSFELIRWCVKEVFMEMTKMFDKTYSITTFEEDDNAEFEKKLKQLCNDFGLDLKIEDERISWCERWV